ncbi:MAG: hypothetical protein IJB01_09395 [Bacteroidaceae bacterium]|nr:hypothetical protein [Bacteroidaceae bacterium]
MEGISTIKERIFTFLAKEGIKKTDFYQATGLPDSNFKGRNLCSQPGGDMIVKILTTYPNLSSEWLIMGRGEMLKTNCAQSYTAPQNIPSALNEDNEKNSTKQVDISAHGEVIDRLVAQITQQAEEIGRLKERIAQLEREKQKNASGAANGSIANVG